MLPPRPTLQPLDDRTLLARAEAAFGTGALPSLRDILDARDTEGREFQLALTRGDVEAARFWYECEWSFRAKEVFRTRVESRQARACVCCGRTDVSLQLNHRTKVRNWGRTSIDNLEALCRECHVHVDRFGRRCHAS